MRAVWIALALLVPFGGAGEAHATTVSRYSIDSRYAHARLRQITVVPPGAARGRPLLVFLHGRGSGPASNVNDAFVGALTAQGARARGGVPERGRPLLLAPPPWRAACCASRC